MKKPTLDSLWSRILTILVLIGVIELTADLFGHAIAGRDADQLAAVGVVVLVVSYLDDIVRLLRAEELRKQG